jgi:nucleoside-diphosphate-sugar epimerase
MTNVLVTGGRGFIGRHLVAALVRAGYSVTSVDTAPASPGHEHARELVVDVRDRAALGGVTSSGAFAIVFDLASHTEIGLPRPAYERNVEATTSMLAAVEAAAIPRYVFFSTQFVFRRPDVAPAREDEYAPVDPYGASKVESEVRIRRALAPDRYLILRPPMCGVPGSRASGTACSTTWPAASS